MVSRYAKKKRKISQIKMQKPWEAFHTGEVVETGPSECVTVTVTGVVDLFVEVSVSLCTVVKSGTEPKRKIQRPKFNGGWKTKETESW